MSSGLVNVVRVYPSTDSNAAAPDGKGSGARRQEPGDTLGEQVQKWAARGWWATQTAQLALGTSPVF